MGTQPNMASTILSFAQLIIKRTITQTVVDHEPVKSEVDTPFMSTITTPKPEDLQQFEIDTSLKYKLSHSVDAIVIDDRFVHKNTVYKVIGESDRDDYGFYRVLGEEVQ